MVLHIVVMVNYGILWSGMVWFGMVPYVLICNTVCVVVAVCDFDLLCLWVCIYIYIFFLHRLYVPFSETVIISILRDSYFCHLVPPDSAKRRNKNPREWHKRAMKRHVFF